MQKKIVLLNGPPRSGKDTAGNFLQTRYNFRLEKFAQPIRDAMCTLFGIEDKDIEELKHISMMGGHTLRQWMIGYSEDYLKKYGGSRVFGELLVRRIEPYMHSPRHAGVAITDSGFREEGEAVIDTYGAENVHLVQIHRPDCSFKGDSRSYIELSGIEPTIIHNDGTIWDFKAKLMDVVAPLVPRPIAA